MWEMRGASGVNLQRTLAAATVDCGAHPVGPHHPITCEEGLAYHPDRSLSCAHARTHAHEARVQACLNGTIAILLIELATTL